MFLQVVFLPEASDYIASNKDEANQLAESLNGQLMSEYKYIAKSKNVWLSIGGFHEKLDKVNISFLFIFKIIYDTLQNTKFNSHVIIDDCGEIKSIYRKIHLFDVAIPEKNIYLRESDFNIGGSQITQPVVTPAGLVGLGIVSFEASDVAIIFC